MASGKKLCPYWLGDSWQGTDCDQLSHPLAFFLQDSCVRYLPRLYLDIHVRECCLVGWDGVGQGRVGQGGVGGVGKSGVGWGRVKQSGVGTMNQLCY